MTVSGLELAKCVLNTLSSSSVSQLIVSSDSRSVSATMILCVAEFELPFTSWPRVYPSPAVVPSRSLVHFATQSEHRLQAILLSPLSAQSSTFPWESILSHNLETRRF